MVTGVGDEELVAKALRLGAVNYVPKQAKYLETLPDLLRGVMEERRRKESQGLLATRPRRILYVEHVAADIELTLRHFAEAAPHFAVDVVHSCSEALTRLEQQPAYDLSLIDLRMPDLSGLEFIRKAKRCRFPLPPFIMISGTGDEATAIATLRMGAADYIAKREGYLDQLVYTIEHAIAYDQLNRLDQQLRVEVAERKRAEELQRCAAETAEAANLAKSEFLARVSHELRTPLNAILGFTEGLLEHADREPLSEHQKDRLTKIMFSGQHLLRLINKVLDITRIESGDREVDITTFDAGPLALEVCQLCEALVEGKPQVRLVLDVESGLPPIASDRQKLKEILLNLIGNAIAFTDRGSVTLRGRLRDSFLVLSVEDTGVGIPAEHLGRVFDAFYQVKQPGLHPRQGTGLGLAICKTLAELLGGTISLRSEVNCGTTASVTLPLLANSGNHQSTVNDLVAPPGLSSRERCPPLPADFSETDAIVNAVAR
jgi:signal transduction histidine kinase